MGDASVFPSVVDDLKLIIRGESVQALAGGRERSSVI